MRDIPTQLEYNLVKRRQRKEYCKIDLLNYKYQKVDEISGVVVGKPSFTNSATSDIRRTCSISLIPKEKKYNVEYGAEIWLDKYLQIYIGLENFDGEIEYTNMGVYLINNPSQVYSATNNTITINGLDLMSKLTGLRNGNLEGLTHIIPQGSNVRQAIITLITEAGFTKYIVDEMYVSIDNIITMETPYEITIDVGGTVYELLVQLRDILPQYQIYFDVDGVFHFNLIPSGENEQIMIDDDIWKSTLINYTKSYDFENVKNVIEVVGKTHDISNYGIATLNVSTFTYNSSISSVTSLYDYMEIGFTTKGATNNPHLNMNSLGAYQIIEEDGTAPKMLDNIYYVVRWSSVKTKWIFLGEVTPTAIIEETNPNSPFYVNGTFGKVRIALSGTDYDSINSSYLAYKRCKYELYTRCRLQDKVVLNCVPIYWLDVNWVIEITLPNKQGTEITEKYLIKEINISNTQSISLMKYYPYYPSV